jgi:hypothetical protein
MSDTQLQIVISVLNNASEQLAEVGGQLSSLGTDATTAAETMQSSLSAAEEQIAASAQAAADAWAITSSDISKDFEEIVPAVSEVLQSLAEVNESAAMQVAATWKAQGQAMEADIAAAMTEVETTMVGEATAAGEAAGTAAGEGFGGYFQKMIVGFAFEQIGSFLSGGIESAIAAVSKSGNQIATLTAQIDGQKASIAVNEAALRMWRGTTVQIAAAHEKAAANIEAEKIKITELTQQLAPLTQAHAGLTGQITSVGDATLIWIGQNKQLETSLQTFMTTLGPMLIAIGGVLIVITLLGIAFAALSTPLLIVTGIAIAIAILYALWKSFHTEIVSFFNDLNAKTGILDLFKQSWKSISDDWTNDLLPALKQLWTALQPLEPYMKAWAEVIGVTLLGAIVLLTDTLTLAIQGFTDILTIGTKVATFFTNVLVVSLNAVEHAIEAIITAVSKVGSAGGAIGGVISGALSAVHLASGGIVSSPTFALIGEAGPEAVIPLSAFNGSSLAGGGGYSGGGNIVINIGSLVGTDAQSATKFGNQLARLIQQQIRMKNYA